MEKGAWNIHISLKISKLVKGNAKIDDKHEGVELLIWLKRRISKGIMSERRGSSKCRNMQDISLLPQQLLTPQARTLPQKLVICLV